MTVKIRERGSVGTEEVPEETYPDLLPFEMERVEAVMGTLYAPDRKIKESEEELVGSINDGIASAKSDGNNSWGHEWRERPLLTSADKPLGELKGIPSQARENLSRTYWGEALGKPDPILDRALKMKDVILDNVEGFDQIPAECRYQPTEEEKARHFDLLMRQLGHGGDKDKPEEEEEERPETD